MKIYIDQIPESGLVLTESCDPSTLDLNRPDIRFTDPINISAQITKGINCLCVDLKIDATIHLDCSRCLEEFTTPKSLEIKLNFPIENKASGPTAHRVYDPNGSGTRRPAGVIDLADNLREEIILNYPLKPLCRSDCLGLCPTCGQNLNKAKCNCKPRS